MKKIFLFVSMSLLLATPVLAAWTYQPRQKVDINFIQNYAALESHNLNKYEEFDNCVAANTGHTHYCLREWIKAFIYVD